MNTIDVNCTKSRATDDSLYSLKNGYYFKNSISEKQNSKYTLREVDIQAKFMLREYDIIDLLILKALYKYQWLNAFNIEKYLNSKLKNKLQKPTYKNNIKKLLSQGAIEAIRYGNDEIAENDLVLYFLPVGSYMYIKNTYNHLPVTHIHTEADYHLAKDIKDSDIMERLSLNQWHIDMISKYKNSVTEEKYFEKKRCGMKKYKMLSYISIKGESGSRRHNITFLAIPAARSEKSIKKMEYSLVKADNAIQTSLKKEMIIIITCSTLAQMTAVNKTILENIHPATMPVYVLDSDTAEGTQMDALYMCGNENETREEFKTYSLIV